MSRSLHATSTETETETTTIINNKVESSVVASNNIANNNKKHASMSSSQIPVLSKKPHVAPKPTNVPSSPARKAKSVGQQPSGLPVPIEVLAAMAGSPSLLEGHDESPEKLSLKARLKLFEKEIEQQGSDAPAPQVEKKKFSFLNPDEIAKMKEEEEKRIAQMTRMEFDKMTSAVSREAESWTDATLEDVEAMDRMARGQMQPKHSLDSSAMPHSIPYTAKGERLLRERLEREGEPLPEELETLDNLSPEEKKAYEAERRVAWRKARLKSLENDAIQAQLVIQKMSEMTTQESSDDLDPISESPSKTLDEDRDESSSDDGNDETLGDDDILEAEDDVEAEAANAIVQANENNDNISTNQQTLDTANANLDFRNATDIENNIPVEVTETSEEPISHELTNPPEAIHEEVVETTPEQLEQEQLNSASASPRSSSPSVKSSSSSSPPSDSSSIHDEEIKDGNVVNSG